MTCKWTNIGTQQVEAFRCMTTWTLNLPGKTVVAGIGKIVCIIPPVLPPTSETSKTHTVGAGVARYWKPDVVAATITVIALQHSDVIIEGSIAASTAVEVVHILYSRVYVETSNSN